ncbi:MAG: hypothetical protein KGS46_16335 [Chloroflexi bacterium]|nr:hypothetical protein [Chloroflexota bacterium]
MKLLTTIVLVFVAALGLMIGWRMEQQTMAILAGVAIGFVVAAIAIGAVAFVMLEKSRITNPPPALRTPPTTPNSYELRDPHLPVYAPYAYPSQPALPPPSYPASYGDPRYAATIGRMPLGQSVAPPMLAMPRRFFVIGAAGQPEEVAAEPDDQNPYGF